MIAAVRPHAATVRQAEEARGLPRPVQEGGHVPGQPRRDGRLEGRDPELGRRVRGRNKTRLSVVGHEPVRLVDRLLNLRQIYSMRKRLSDNTQQAFPTPLQCKCSVKRKLNILYFALQECDYW